MQTEDNAQVNAALIAAGWLLFFKSCLWAFSELRVQNGYENLILAYSIIMTLLSFAAAKTIFRTGSKYLLLIILIPIIGLLSHYTIYSFGGDQSYLYQLRTKSTFFYMVTICFGPVLDSSLICYFIYCIVNKDKIITELKLAKSIYLEYFESICIAVLLALFIRTFLFQAFKIPSGSMEDTLLIGDHLLVNKFLYHAKTPITGTKLFSVRDPRQGDVIVFEYPEDPSKDFIKRVIGVPGDVVEGKDKKVFVNGRQYENPHEVHKEKEIIPKEMNSRDTFGPITVPPDSYFVMGDNRDRSYDSRFWKFVKREQIKGLAFIKYWSWDREKFRPRLGSIGNLIK